MEIVLIRHGQPEFEIKGYARANEIPGIVDSYNQSGITDSPPKELDLLDICRDAVVCSDLPRSLKSAEALGITNIHLSDSIFREIALPHFERGSIPLPLGIWIAILRILSVMGFSRNGESISMARKRARQAVSTLIEIAQNHRSVVLVGHGFMNYLIAKELLSRKWVGPSKPGSKYWEYAIYRGAE